MGNKVGIDKHLNNIEEILQMQQISKIKFDVIPPNQITHHLKVFPSQQIWKFYQSDQNIKYVKTSPICLNNLNQKPFTFSPFQSYLILIIYKRQLASNKLGLKYCNSIQNLIESMINISPRGIKTPVGTSAKCYMDCIPIYKGYQKNNQQLQFQIYAINGKKCTSIVRSFALARAFQLDTLINKQGKNLLQLFFAGTVIRSKKMQKGTIVQIMQDKTDTSHQEVFKNNQNQYKGLFKTLFNSSEKKKLNILTINNKRSYQQNFVYYGKQQKEHKEQKSQEIMIKEESLDNQTNNLPKLQFKPPKLNLNFSGNDKAITERVVSINLAFSKDQQEEKVQKNQQTIEDAGYNIKNRLIKKLEIPELKKQPDFKYEDIEQQSREGKINFNIGVTHRHYLKMKYFQKDCSNVIDDFLYVSGQQIAYNKQQLQLLGITHIINCAADYCYNKFTDDFQLSILSIQNLQNIQCIFYQCIFFIEKVREENGKVLIHCIQGVSRSVTIAMAYLIFKNRVDYKQAERIIRSKRGVASPNNGFMVQLMIFHKRLFQPHTLSLDTKVFSVGSHEIESPGIIVARLVIIHNSYYQICIKDTRGIFIIVCKHKIYIWIGKECKDQRKKVYLEYSYYYIRILQKMQKAPQSIEQINEYQQKALFWKYFNLAEPPQLGLMNNQWDNWFIDPKGQNQKVNMSKQIGFYRNLYNVDDEEQKKQKNKLYIYPDNKEGLGIFYLQDLNAQTFAILCKKMKDQSLRVFIWKGLYWNGKKQEENLFLDYIIENYYKDIDEFKILIFQQYQQKESEQFLKCFQQ